MESNESAVTDLVVSTLEDENEGSLNNLGGVNLGLLRLFHLLL